MRPELAPFYSVRTQDEQKGGAMIATGDPPGNEKGSGQGAPLGSEETVARVLPPSFFVNVRSARLYRTVAPVIGVVCSGCGQPVNRAAGKNDQSDATLPVSIYGCACACFSSKDLDLPLTQSYWDAKRSAPGGPATDGCPSTIEVSLEAKSPDPVEAPQPEYLESTPPPPAYSEPGGTTMNSLVLYDAMRLAIARCFEVDEAAGIKNKAAQLEAYARVRDDAESQQRFAEIRVRACLKIGELSRELEVSEQAKGGRHDNGDAPTKTETLAKAGVNIRTAERYEELAGGKEKQAQKVASAATEAYFAAQQTNGGEVSMGGLKGAVRDALVKKFGESAKKPALAKVVAAGKMALKGAAKLATPRAEKKAKEPVEVQPLMPEEATSIWLCLLNSLPERQRPAVARAAFHWTKSNHSLLGNIDVKYGQARTMEIAL